MFGIDEYTGLIANDVIVNGDGTVTKLYSYNATVNNLNVKGGKVELHTSGNAKYGNTYFVVDAPADSKQVCIREGITISGGDVKIGHATGTYLQTSLGRLTYNDVKTNWKGEITSVGSAEVSAANIVQTGGTLKIQGDSVSVGGLHITQYGKEKSTMSISAGTAEPAGAGCPGCTPPQKVIRVHHK